MRDWIRNTTTNGFERLMANFVDAADRDLRDVIDLVRVMRGGGRA